MYVSVCVSSPSSSFRAKSMATKEPCSTRTSWPGSEEESSSMRVTAATALSASHNEN